MFSCLPITNECIAYLGALADTTIDGSEFTFTGGVIDGQKGWYPNVAWYPAMYCRDFAMTVRGRPSKFTAQDLMNALALFVSQQRVDGAFPDGIYPDGVSLAGGGGRYFGYDNSFEFVDIAYQHFLKTGTTLAMSTYLDEITATLGFATLDNHLVVLAEGEIGFGFQDSVLSVGQELGTSCLRYRAYSQLATMAAAGGLPDVYSAELPLISAGLEDLWDGAAGLYRNASVQNMQHSIPGNAMAVAFGAAPSARADTIAQFFFDARPGYPGHAANTIYQNGMIRHLPLSDGYWEVTDGIPPDQYQNGPYWGTFTGWAAMTLARASKWQADMLVNEVVNYYKSLDPGVCPLEFYLVENEAAGAPRYCSSVTLPLEYLMP